MILKNPCKICITKPVCERECDDLTDYGETIYGVFYILFMVIIALIFVSICLLLYFILPSIFTTIFMTSVLSIGYFLSIREIITDNVKEKILWKNVVICLFGPLLMIASFLGNAIGIDQPLDNFIYKHNKKVN